MKNAFRQAFPLTIPVMAGYLSLGIAFGILLQSAGYGPLWAFGMSLIIYAGSAEFLCVELLAAHASLSHVALLTFLLNFRHFFYGLSMITRYQNTGKRKWYLIFGLTDETYALLTAAKTPQDTDSKDFYYAVTLLNHSYWVLGSVIGAVAGKLLPIDTTGIDFSMTALFAVLVVEQWKAHSKHLPALLGFGATIVSLIIFGPDSFLIPALLVISAALLFLQPKTNTQSKEDTL